MRHGETALSKKVNLLINNKKIGMLTQSRTDVYPLSPGQTQAIIAAIKGHGKVQIQAGKTMFELSNAGAAAVWLKADEFQQFGKLKPQAKPIIKKAKTVSGSLKISATEEDRIRQLLRQNLNDETCSELHAHTHEVSLYRLNQQNLLAETICWSGAYNLGYVYAILDNSRQKVRHIATTDGSDYQNGQISSYHKSRGVGDCWSGEEYVWDGKRFVQTEIFSTGMCRGFAGGAWSLPTWVSDVK